MADPVHPRSGSPDVPTDDLARALPDPPPPRPARRAEAIASAIERFDRHDDEPRSATTTPPPRSSRRWWRTGRAQVAALASAALVVLVAVPLALEHPDGRIGSPIAPSPPKVDDQVRSFAPAAPPRDRGTRPPNPRPTDRPRQAAIPAQSRSRDGVAPPTAVPEELEPASPPASVAPAPPPSPPSPPPPPPPPPPPAPVAEALADATGIAQRASSSGDAAANVVVTGSRVSHPARGASRRGDWNACTLADPEQSLRGCSELTRAGGGAAGAAGAQIVDGLTMGWNGNLNGALAAFGRAIALQPRLGIAHLNRGLAHERLGESDEALVEFDDAVRLDRSARSYYVRSRARRARGDIRGARADADRAVDLDPDYATVAGD